MAQSGVTVRCRCSARDHLDVEHSLTSPQGLPALPQMGDPRCAFLFLSVSDVGDLGEQFSRRCATLSTGRLPGALLAARRHGEHGRPCVRRCDSIGTARASIVGEEKEAVPWPHGS